MITNVVQYLDRQLREQKDKVAVAEEKVELTFEEIHFGATNIAQHIHTERLRYFNKPIIVFCTKSVMEYVALMGVLYSGNYYVPLDVKMPKERLKLIIGLLEAEIAITTSNLVSLLQETGFVGKIILLEKEVCERIPKGSVEKWSQNTIDTDPAYVLFTSGSTGIPKGVVVSHRAIIDYIEWQCERFQFDKTSVLGNQAPFYFDASMPDIYTPLCSGATLQIIPEMLFLLPNKLIDYINEKKINTLIWVPSALMMLTNRDYFAQKSIEELRLVMFCGEVMPNKHLNIWRRYYPNAKFVNLYGPTEAAYACTYYEVDRKFTDEEPLPIGKPCENTDIIVLNENNQRVQKNEEGELCIRGSCLANGYYNNSVKTEEAFTINPLNNLYEERIYRTGDIVRYNEYMELEYVGRRDFQIKHMGYRIELGEIETAAYGMEEMRQCCAIYDNVENQIVLYCVVEKEKTEKDIFAFLKGKIPKYMLPGKILLESELPLNANGKIDRLLLKTKAQEK